MNPEQQKNVRAFLRSHVLNLSPKQNNSGKQCLPSQAHNSVTRLGYFKKKQISLQKLPKKFTNFMGFYEKCYFLREKLL